MSLVMNAPYRRIVGAGLAPALEHLPHLLKSAPMGPSSCGCPVSYPRKSSGKTASPASVMRPSCNSRATRVRLDADQGLLARRGVKRPAYASPSIPLIAPSIRPKHKAPSTASPYEIPLLPDLVS